MFTPEEIRSVEFNKSTVGGYKSTDVDYFIEDVAITVETLNKENAELKKKLEVLASKIEEYRSDEDSIHIALVNAQRLADQLKKDAQKTHDELVGKAEEKRDKLVSEAQAQSAEMMEEAKKRATDLIADATEKAEAILNAANTSVASQHDAYMKIKEDASNFRGRLLSYYKAHLEQIDKLSELLDADPISAAEEAVDNLGGNHILNDDFQIEIKPIDIDDDESDVEPVGDVSAEYEPQQVEMSDKSDEREIYSEEAEISDGAAEAASDNTANQYESGGAYAETNAPAEAEMAQGYSFKSEVNSEINTSAQSDNAQRPVGGFKVSIDDFSDDDDDDFDVSSDNGRLKFGGYNLEDDDENEDEKAGFGFFKHRK